MGPVAMPGFMALAALVSAAEKAVKQTSLRGI